MEKIYHTLRTLGIGRTYKGYYYTAHAVWMVMADATMLLYISKDLYPEIAKKHHTSVNCVERNIRTVVSRCWESEYIEALESMAGVRLYRKPTSGEFIDILSNYLLVQKN